MAHRIARAATLAASRTALVMEVARFAIVAGSAVALILAGPSLPF